MHFGYFVISAVGIVFIFGYNSVCAIMRGLGDSKRPMYFVAVSTVTNIILDLIFVGPLHWGAGGAAAATIIAQGISFVSAFIYLYRHREGFVFDFQPKSFRIVGERLKTMLKVGIPFALQFSMLMISMLFVVSMVNSYGVSASAGYGVGGNRWITLQRCRSMHFPRQPPPWWGRIWGHASPSGPDLWYTGVC